eukprot:TRINITY_DN1467_c0_g1::TRINITY_DN1467_c0_g1_i1::g.27238::m.27238 TRINITY_DN1467_c0_g1::TRINITY_DN1467_c0_g1_i1::g.27238  ORF type:complete len:331 (+),score=47.35,BAR/PF03114.13/0.00033,DUF1730/PF08331.5/0.075,DUF4398/PF14346.1/0.12,FUSC/PF04632.7/0.13,Cytochrom_B562/PF07361.6/0.22,Cor1/PF04803.7/2.8e+03,Cor1/PF04803.7/0.087 TRINITY_DN1467_c0_g1_i1:172-1164(+)
MTSDTSNRKSSTGGLRKMSLSSIGDSISRGAGKIGTTIANSVVTPATVRRSLNASVSGPKELNCVIGEILETIRKIEKFNKQQESNETFFRSWATAEATQGSEGQVLSGTLTSIADAFKVFENRGNVFGQSLKEGVLPPLKELAEMYTELLVHRKEVTRTQEAVEDASASLTKARQKGTAEAMKKATDHQEHAAAEFEQQQQAFRMIEAKVRAQKIRIAKQAAIAVASTYRDYHQACFNAATELHRQIVATPDEAYSAPPPSTMPQAFHPGNFQAQHLGGPNMPIPPQNPSAYDSGSASPFSNPVPLYPNPSAPNNNMMMGSNNANDLLM